MVTVRLSDPALSQRMLWGSLVTAATVVATLMLACATPFAGLAVLAALFLPRREAFVLIGVNWLVNQAIGFGLMHYPLDWGTLLGGLGLGVSCVACTGAAVLTAGSLRKVAFPLTAVAAFAAAFVAYEGVNFLASIGHHDGDYSLSVVLYVLYLNGLAFAGLLLLQRVAQAIGVSVPRASLRSPSAHTSAVS